MAGRGEHRRPNRSPTWRRIQFCLAAILSVPLIQVARAELYPQPPNPIVAPGNAAVTGFAGALPPVQVVPGVDPYQITFIDLNGPSLRVIDLRHLAGPPRAQLVGAPKPFTFTAAQIGQVFGVALDDSVPPNIYAAATSAYGLPIVAPGPDGKPMHIKVGTPNASFMAGLFGPQGGPGSIWRIDGTTGRVTLFANVLLDGRPNSGAALGGLAYDAETKSLFVADRETGFIHRFALDGRELGRYDHGVTGRTAQGLPPVAFDPRRRIDITNPQFDSTQPATWNYAAGERRVFGLGVHERRLYYAVADGLQIWSVGLKPDGTFDTDAVIELAVPPAAGPTEIAKITFDEQGRMFLAERPAATGAFDFEALAIPAIGRVLRYAQIGVTVDDRRIWQEVPDEYAIGFAGNLRNANGGVAIGYNYDAAGEIIAASCGGFMWSTGEDLRDSPDATLAAQLQQSGPLHVDGLQGNGTWLIEPGNEPPLASYFVDYVDELQDDAARGHMGDIAIVRACTPPVRAFPRLPRHAGPPLGRPGPPGPPGTPPGKPPPPGGCSPNLLRDVDAGNCVPNCQRPNIQINGKCCSVATIAANAACSNSSCPPGQTAVGPSNFCCNSGQVYTGANGSKACCNGQVVNGRCQPPVPPTCKPSAGKPCCGKGYVPAGNSCCLASQMTSTGMCCPSGQVPSGPNKTQCKPPILIPIGPRCCGPGLIPTGGGKCCAAANVTSGGECCPGPVNAADRSHCPALTPLTPACASGYTRMPDGNCCNNRYISNDGMSCINPQPSCGQGEFRDASGACRPVGLPLPPCAPGTARDANGNCVGGGALLPPPVIIPRGPPHPLPPPRIRKPRGLPPRDAVPPRDLRH